MKLSSLLFLLFVLIFTCYGQYDSTITHYNLYVYQIVDTTITPDVTGYYSYEFSGDTTVILSWTHSSETEPTYLERYATFLAQDTIMIPNTESLWGVWDGTQMVNPDTAYTQETFVLHRNRWYEIAVSAVRFGDFYETSKSKQFYIHVPAAAPEERAIIIIDLKFNSVDVPQ